MGDPRDRYDPELQEGVDWLMVPIVITPFLIWLGVIVYALFFV